VYGVLLRPLPYPEASRLVTVWENNRSLGLDQEQVSAATFVDWRERTRTMEAIAAFRYRGVTLNRDGEPVRVGSVEVSADLFRVLGVSPILGRTFAPEDERPGHEHQVLLSHAAWERRFGADSLLVGSTLRLDGEPYTVVGVMPEGFVFPVADATTEMWSPLTLSLADLPSRPHRMYNAIGRLAGGVPLERAREEMNAIATEIGQENPESNAGWGVTLVPAREQVVGPMRSTLWLLFGAVLLVLLIGCVNIANLLLARSTRLTRDFAVRAAFGASGPALMRRSLAESIWLAGGGGMAGLLVAWWGISVLRSVLPDAVPRSMGIRLDPVVVVFALGISVLAGVLFGLAPALRAMRPNLNAVLQDAGRGSGYGRRTRWVTNGFVVAEVALALVLSIGAALLARSFIALTDVDPGFRQTGVVSVALQLPASRYGGSDRPRQFFERLLPQIRNRPEVQRVGAVSALPLSPVGVDFEINFSLDGLDAASPSERPRADYRAVMPGYFAAMGIPLLEGRTVDDFDLAERHRVALINETLRRRYFSDRPPLGAVLRRMPMLGDLEIVGVVGDVRHHGFSTGSRPEVFVPFSQLPLSEMHLVLATDEAPGAIARVVAREVRALDAELPLRSVTPIEDLVSASIAQPRFNMVLMLGLAVCALVIAAVGIYGVVAYAVAQRTAEIGVRMALGASDRDTLRLIVGQVLRVVLLGVAAGVLGAGMFSRFLGAMLFGVGATDGVTYVAMSLILILVALAAAVIPARRAMQVDPVEALRQT